MLATKQHTIDDFIGCGKWLVAHRYTSPQHLAGEGTSAGGITIGGAITQAPKLFAAALDVVGVSDALRSEFTPNGPPNIPEFGTQTTAAGFHDLYPIDAYLQVRDGVAYPAVMLITGINDPRVSPWELGKFAARLQAATSSGRPILLRVDYDAGHGFMASSRAQSDALLADQYSFLLWQLGDPGFAVIPQHLPQRQAKSLPVIDRRLFLAGSAAALASAVRSPAAAQTRIPLKIGATANDSFAEAYYAQDLGYFTRAGIDAEITTFANGAQVSTGVASGALDVGISSVITLANATIRGLPFVYIAGGGMYTATAPTIVLCVAKDSAVTSARDLEGKAVSVSGIKDITHLAVVTWLEANGADPAKVSIIEMPFSQVSAALNRGTIAAGIISEPSLAASLADVRVLAKPFELIGKRLMIGGWFARGRLGQAEPRFGSCVRDGDLSDGALGQREPRQVGRDPGRSTRRSTMPPCAAWCG